MPYLKLFRRWVTLYLAYEHYLEGNYKLQHQILMSTLKSPQARQFVETHTDRLLELCMYPEVAQLLRAAKGQ